MQWVGEFPKRAIDDLQTANLHVEPRGCASFEEALCLHRPRVGTVLLLAVRPRAEHSEVPALLVLYRGGAVGIQHVALVEHRLGDPIHAIKICRRVHRPTASSTGSTLSRTCSHVGIP